jgi:transposase InsO family protein
MKNNDTARPHERWAQVRFAVVGPLLAAPPPRGELGACIERLAEKEWRHPISGTPRYFGASTIERWYYAALHATRDPVGALQRKVRDDAGLVRRMNPKLRAKLLAQYEDYKSWSFLLHYDNLVAVAEQDAELGPVPSYATVRRFMKANGLLRVRRPVGGDRPGAREARAIAGQREVRSFEALFVGGLWHLDFHEGSRRVLLPNGTYATPQLLGILDDRSRLACHLQWYLHESAENLIHGLCQALQKRGLPRALMSDNGSAMTAAETTAGLSRLGITHETTLRYSPYQNGKQEAFWSQIEGRLLPMLKRHRKLALPLLNEATLAWMEYEYNREVHGETRQTPLDRFLKGPDVMRPCPGSDALRKVFLREERRTPRRSDGTVVVEGVRFELPNAYRHLEKVFLRWASWDLSRVYLTDGRSGVVQCPIYPLDKAKNADGRRRAVRPGPVTPSQEPDADSEEIAPLLSKYLAQARATGLPAPYLTKDENVKGDRDNG